VYVPILIGTSLIKLFLLLLVFFVFSVPRPSVYRFLLTIFVLLPPRIRPTGRKTPETPDALMVDMNSLPQTSVRGLTKGSHDPQPPPKPFADRRMKTLKYGKSEVGKKDSQEPRSRLGQLMSLFGYPPRGVHRLFFWRKPVLRRKPVFRRKPVLSP
jgi:hypothetical protein